MNKALIKRDKKLLKLAQNIFGSDLVVDAFHCIYDYNDPVEIKEAIDNVMICCEITDDYKNIDFSANEIMLVFSNGKKVCFSVSEWGSIDSPYSDTEYVEI